MKISDVTYFGNVDWTVGRYHRDREYTSFADILKKVLSDVQQLQEVNRENNYLLVTGQIENPHKVMIDAEKAYIALQFVLQIRNKILDAYQEIMRINI